MASSSSTKPNPDNGTIVIVTQHEFNQFHKIDRILFTRLVVSLGRDPGEAMKVVAYLVWLEKMSKDFDCIISAVTKIINDVCLRAFPDIVQEIQQEKEQKPMNNSVGNIFSKFIYYNPPQAIGIVPQCIGIAVSQGSDCVHPFVALQNCIKANPNAFSEDILNEDEVKETDPTPEYNIHPPKWSRESHSSKSKL
ncbi:mitochondrial intermembrane space import and assembly protein 40-like protein [Senna tora]|uniref:Mitochondrial intermembrane space import and assembly protein 40-like protein n=1 Tax=Senna tora TaxID=362788 RepID=A0A834W737_9FABA|nr:mitochondrial intermembrane space import and assembly protein 40-like protein [Senna tora]